MYVGIYWSNYVCVSYLCYPCICLKCCLSVFLIVWMDCPALCCWGRPPPGRRDFSGPGGRHRGERHGKQIQQPFRRTTTYQRRTYILTSTEESMFLNDAKCTYVVVMAYRGFKDTLYELDIHINYKVTILKKYYKCLCVYVCMFVCLCMYVCMYVFMYVCIYNVSFSVWWST